MIVDLSKLPANPGETGEQRVQQPLRGERVGTTLIALLALVFLLSRFHCPLIGDSCDRLNQWRPARGRQRRDVACC